MDHLHYPSMGETWRHYKGNEYEVLLLTNQYSEHPEHPPTVSYRGANGKAWSKTLDKFLEKMTFVRKAEEVECGTLTVPTLGITGVRPGSTWVNDGADFPTSDIDLRYSKESGRCETEIWYGAIHVTAQTAEQAEELRDLVIKGLNMATTLRDSLEFETKLAAYHEAVWNDGQQGYAYDEAGEDVAKDLIAMYRGEETYTHHLDMTIIEGLNLQHCTAHVDYDPASRKGEAVLPAPVAAPELHPLIKCLHANGLEIAKRATEMQLETLAKASDPDLPMFDRFIRPGD